MKRLAHGVGNQGAVVRFLSGRRLFGGLVLGTEHLRLANRLKIPVKCSGCDPYRSRLTSRSCDHRKKMRLQIVASISKRKIVRSLAYRAQVPVVQGVEIANEAASNIGTTISMCSPWHHQQTSATDTEAWQKLIGPILEVSRTSQWVGSGPWIWFERGVSSAALRANHERLAATMRIRVLGM